MDGKLFGEVIRREEGMAGIEPLLILTVAALHLAVMSGRIRTNPFIPAFKTLRRQFKPGGNILLAVGTAIRELKSVICLNTFHLNSSAIIPCRQFLQKVC